MTVERVRRWGREVGSRVGSRGGVERADCEAASAFFSADTEKGLYHGYMAVA